MIEASHLPDLPLAAWRDTKTTLHLFTQIVGKVRLALHPPLNHWWHVTFTVSPHGLTTGSIPHDQRLIELEFDLVRHELVIRCSHAEARRIGLAGASVASFHREVLAALDGLGAPVQIVARPFDPARVGSDIPFAQDEEHASYDREYVDRFRRILGTIEPVFRVFRGRFLGKCSPVHFFWHSFDLAVTRFSGRAVEVDPDADPVTRAAYSHEVISSGFWVGDDDLPEPAFYCYTAPEPRGLSARPLRPAEASWQDVNGGSLAIYRYADFRAAADPEAALLEFLQSSYEAGAELAGWDRAALELTPRPAR